MVCYAWSAERRAVASNVCLVLFLLNIALHLYCFFTSLPIPIHNSNRVVTRSYTHRLRSIATMALNHLELRFLTLLASLSLLGSFSFVDTMHHMKRAPLQYVSQRGESRPLTITNQCPELIYPGIATQAGTPPSTQGFPLAAGDTRELTVGADWQGRVWGRTNCSFNADGSGPSNTGGNNGGGSACVTGDCNGVVDCVVTVSTISYHAGLSSKV